MEQHHHRAWPSSRRLRKRPRKEKQDWHTQETAVVTGNASIARKQNTILKSLISETSTGPNNQPPFKYAVNSTIIQHAPTFQRTAESDSAEEQTTSLAKVGRRGMHSAAGAYWNSEKDGMWSFKYDGGEKKGLDVVINVMWISL